MCAQQAFEQKLPPLVLESAPSSPYGYSSRCGERTMCARQAFEQKLPLLVLEIAPLFVLF